MTSPVVFRGSRLALAATLLAIVQLGASSGPSRSQEGPARTLPIGYVEIADDARYEPIRSQRIVISAPHRPWHGAEVAIDDAAALQRLTRTTLRLVRITTAPDRIGSAIAEARRSEGVGLFLLDLPASSVQAVAGALKGSQALAFNVSAPEDTLRREHCAREIVHILPSLAMRADALLQHLVSRKWRELLLLEGPEQDDAAFATALQRSARKLGARVAAHTKFKLGNDPRERDLNNPALLTAINRDYDIVLVADRGLELARQLPFRTVRPRPVAGSVGLDAEAWHWTQDRFGGPQLNGRFQARSGGLRMGSADWAAWMAVKMISEAVLRTGSIDIAALRRHIVEGGGTDTAGFDGAKGLAVSVRRWDQQLRQPMLMATSLAVVGLAPIDGFLHQTNRLDSLGDDAPETSCRLDRQGR